MQLYERLDLTGTALSWRDQDVAYHGPADDPESVYPGRRVLQVPVRDWPAARPEDCRTELDSGKAQWLTLTGTPADLGADPESAVILVCSGCGPACT